MRSLIIPLIVLGLPLAEIAGFVIVGREIGLLMTLLLVFLSAVVGIFLLRIQGFGVLQRLQDAARTGNDPGLDVLGAALIFIAAVLLIIPGFVGDIVGLLLFLPPVRRAFAAFLRTRVTILTAGTGFYRSSGPRREQPRGPLIIDLDEDEFSRKGKDEDDSSPPNNRISH
ncbi:FxsA family protein [Sinorhizobium numidicum]|uniref:FxsA family protein n=1 Tax=Sinorhizobium numidicum TaxID=680248 RepID=A0ABY8D1Q9_9HYPH|nr:FxsA family protein [Sinorhizobium numidicum]WEX77413.1 FxsA family protein [Sinorhizobium numidicum]WEX84072.1 FxsA family protein [Sinorhizobium numidicum]